MSHRVTLDLSGVHEPGSYIVELRRVRFEEFRPSKRLPPAQRIWWEFEVIAGERAGEPLYHETPLRDDLMFLLLKTLRALGVPADMAWSFEFDEVDGTITDPDLAGRRAKARLTRHNGFTRVRLTTLAQGDQATK